MRVRTHARTGLQVLRLLKHEMELVRKKAVCALHRLYQMDSGCLVDHVPKVRGALCDRDPSVMGATLPLFADMAKDQPQQFKDLVPSFVSILKQLTDHRLPREYDYHRIPAPWIQVNEFKRAWYTLCVKLLNDVFLHALVFLSPLLPLPLTL